MTDKRHSKEDASEEKRHLAGAQNAGSRTQVALEYAAGRRRYALPIRRRKPLARRERNRFWRVRTVAESPNRYARSVGAGTARSGSVGVLLASLCVICARDLQMTVELAPIAGSPVGAQRRVHVTSPGRWAKPDMWSFEGYGRRDDMSRAISRMSSSGIVPEMRDTLADQSFWRNLTVPSPTHASSPRPSMVSPVREALPSSAK